MLSTSPLSALNVTVWLNDVQYVLCDSRAIHSFFCYVKQNNEL